MRWIVCAVLLVPWPTAWAQDAIFKCVGKDGAITYQNSACPDDARVDDIREYEALSPEEALWARQQQAARTAAQVQRHDARQAARQQQPRTRSRSGRLTEAQQRRRECEAARADRDKARRNAPLWRDVHYMAPWDKRVREACKGRW